MPCQACEFQGTALSPMVLYLRKLEPSRWMARLCTPCRLRCRPSAAPQPALPPPKGSAPSPCLEFLSPTLELQDLDMEMISKGPRVAMQKAACPEVYKSVVPTCPMHVNSRPS